jgi:hypothetical protein
MTVPRAAVVEATTKVTLPDPVPDDAPDTVIQLGKPVTDQLQDAVV